ncbi:MAG: hypothetical protein K2Z80_16865 [Xanthobacteraceae bacterium]|nr:hypothetical protein [Xanthobacteraceae bacterium]
MSANVSPLSRWQFSLKHLLFAVVLLSVFLWWNPYRDTPLGLIVAAVIFNAALIVAGLLLRRPVPCAIAWSALRLTVFVIFLMRGTRIPGDEGFAAFAWQVHLDLPLFLLAGSIGVDYWYICLLWYPVAGYLFGRWVQSMYSTRTVQQG